MESFVVCLCVLALGMCQIIIGQALISDSERKVKEVMEVGEVIVQVILYNVMK